ncbi:MAG: hypothetical protein IJ154_05800 [Bacteroidales bacterium]|nr:hypothetical protein [Bacteroidales bacterium]
MSELSATTTLKPISSDRGSAFYQLQTEGLQNEYYIISSEGTRRLMSSPEVVGYESYLAMQISTTAALRSLFRRQKQEKVDILTILRGGLNYPLEECCYKAGLKVPNMNFISCERTIKDGIITGLDIKYEKLHIAKGVTMMIGDIIATGDTLRMCLHEIVDFFYQHGGSIKRIIFFTIGGTKAIEVMEDLAGHLRERFPEFECFQCVFYEGIFTIYQDKGVTGVNIPEIDFGWKDGVVSPEFREYVLKYSDNALFEKCIIYDGGARRYEIPLHYEEVTGYWQDLLAVSEKADFEAFIAEKIGYQTPVSYEDWQRLTYFKGLGDLHALYELEQEFVARASRRKLKDICEQRLQEVKATLGKYII